jgi:hypothetical protein
MTHFQPQAMTARVCRRSLNRTKDTPTPFGSCGSCSDDGDVGSDAVGNPASRTPREGWSTRPCLPLTGIPLRTP